MAWSKLGQFKEGPQSVQELHVVNVYKDPEFIKDVAENKSSNLEDLATKYAITTKDVLVYSSWSKGRHEFYRKHKKPFKLIDMTEDYLSFQIKIGITKEDFMQIWEQWIKHKNYSHSDGKIAKNKLPKHDKLLYAIFKARQKNATFPSIYEKYKDRKLAYFEGEPPTEFNSVEKFAQYYRDHKPNPIPPV